MTHEEAHRDDPVREAVRGLEPVAPDPAFLARLRSDFVEGRLEQPERFRRAGRARWAWFVVPAAAAAALMLLLGRGGSGEPEGWVVLGTSGTGALEWDGRTHELASLDEGTDLSSSASAIHVTDGWIDLGRPGVLAVRVNAGSDAVLAASAGDLATSEWELRRGEMQVLTGPGFAGHALAVSTAEGRVEVVGTAFAVFRNDEFTCVCVDEGTARIGVRETDMEPVSSGHRKIMYVDGRAPEILTIVPAHREGLERFRRDVGTVVARP